MTRLLTLGNFRLAALEGVRLKELFAILFAFAVLLAPATASASAAEPHHDMQMMQRGHCQGPMSGSVGHDRNTAKTCCISICMAVAAFLTAPQPQAPVQVSSPVFAGPISLSGEPTELPTPPPRLS